MHIDPPPKNWLKKIPYYIMLAIINAYAWYILKRYK